LHVTDNWQMMAGVENFGNRFYREHLDFRFANPAFGQGVFQPGATFYFGSAVTY
jgi:outer membrane receptor protein involved in Fe transport